MLILEATFIYPIVLCIQNLKIEFTKKEEVDESRPLLSTHSTWIVALVQMIWAEAHFITNITCPHKS